MDEQKKPISDEEAQKEDLNNAEIVALEQDETTADMNLNVADKLNELDDDEDEDEDTEPEMEKEFTLTYHISPDQLYEFHLVMGREQVVKNSKRTKIMGYIEIAFGVAYLISLLISGSQMPMQYLLSVLLVGMGIYGITFYRTRFHKNLRKATDRQHAKTSYFQNEIVVDFYPNKCAEHVGGDGKAKDNYWRTIEGVRENEKTYIIDLGQKRCLLLPKSELGDQIDQVDEFFTRICENYEKPRTAI